VQTKRVSRESGLQILLGALDLPEGAQLREPRVNEVLRQMEGTTSRRTESGVETARFLYLDLPEGMNPEEAVAEVSGHPWVEYAEPDGIGWGGGVPNDPSFTNLWYHKNIIVPSASIQTPAAWEITQGSSNVIIAVLDTGLKVSDEFTNRVVAGYNFVSGNTNWLDDHNHGTAVAGTAAANANNSNQAAGVDWNCRIMPVKVLNSGNSGFYSWWAQGIDFAVSNGATIINLSAGGSTSDTTLTTAITNAIAQGVIFVTITHNSGAGNITFPGDLTNCITVGATTTNDTWATFSNYGPEIDLVAPGKDMLVITRTGLSSGWYGTSFSAPLVSGVCGLLASVRPGLTHEEARQLLCAGADDQVGDAYDTVGFDIRYGWGRLNAYNSLILAQAEMGPPVASNGVPKFSWSSPPNASNKQPVEIESCDLIEDGWNAGGSTNGLFYTTNQTFFHDTNDWSGPRFYRLKLRLLP
jgi:thermitase